MASTILYHAHVGGSAPAKTAKNVHFFTCPSYMASSASSATVPYPVHQPPQNQPPAQAVLRAADILPARKSSRSGRGSSRHRPSTPGINRPNIYVLPQGMMRDPYQHGPFDMYHRPPSYRRRSASRTRMYDHLGRSFRDRNGRLRYHPKGRAGMSSRVRPLGSHRTTLRRRYQDLYTRHRSSRRPSTAARRRRKSTRTVKRAPTSRSNLDRQLRDLKRQMLVQSEVMRMALQRNRTHG